MTNTRHNALRARSNISRIFSKKALLAFAAFSFTSAAALAADYTWDGTTDTDWTGANWTITGLTGQDWADNNAAFFTGDTDGTVNVDTAISQTGITFTGNANWLFTGGNIGGGGSLTKNGTGTLTLTGTNSYTGTTTVSAGILQIDNITDNIGTGRITLNGTGTLKYTGGDEAFTNQLAGNGGAFEIAAGTTLTQNGRLTGTITKTGEGTLVLSDIVSGSNNDNEGGRIIVNAGTVYLDKTAGQTAHALGSNGGTDYALILNGGLVKITGTNTNTAGNKGNQFYMNSGVKINGGTLDLNGRSEEISNLDSDSGKTDGIVTSATAATLTIGINNRDSNYSGTITDALAITKTGTGTVIFSGDNTYTGVTTIGGGILQISDFNNIGTGNIVLNSGGTLKITGGGTNNYSFANQLSGDGGALEIAAGVTATSTYRLYRGVITKTGEGTLVFAGSSDNDTGRLIVDAGTVILAKTGNTNAVGNGTDALVINNDATVILDNTVTNTQIWTGSQVRLTGGTLDMNGKSETFAKLDGTGGVIKNDTGTLSTLSIGNNGNNSSSYAGKITGNIALTKTGAGTFTLTGDNTYTGATTISAGTFNLAGSVTSNVTIANNANLVGAGTITGDLTFAGNSTFTTGAEALTVTGTLTDSGTVTVNLTDEFINAYITTGNTNVITFGNTTGNASYILGTVASVTGDTRLTFGTTGDILTKAANAVTITVTGAADLIWAGDGTSSTWTLLGGITNWSGASDGDNQFYIGDNVTFNNAAANKTVTVTGTVAPANMIVKDATYIFNDGVINAGAITFNSRTTVNSQLAGTGALTLNTTGTTTIVDLFGDNSGFSGDITITQGRLQVSDASSGTGNIIFDGTKVAETGTGTASLQQNGRINITIGADRKVIINDGKEGTFFVWGSQTTTVDAVISGGGSLRKEDGGTLVLNGNNTYTGGTTIKTGTLHANMAADGDAPLGTSDILLAGGTLILSTPSAGVEVRTTANNITITSGALYASEGEHRITGTVAVNGNATFGVTFDKTKHLVFVGELSGNGAITINKASFTYSGNNAAVVFAADNTGLTSNITISNNIHNVLRIGDDAVNGGTTGTLGAGNVTNNGQLHFNRSNTYQVDNTISGSGTVTQLGTGTTILTGTNTYTGATIVDAGKLVVDGSITSAVTVNTGGTLGGSGTITGNITVATGATLAPGNSPGTLHVAGNVTLERGAVLVFEIESTTNKDQLKFNGGILTFEEGAELQVAVNGSIGLEQFNTAAISVAIGASSIVGYGELDITSNNLDWTITMNSDGVLFATAIPEPSTYALMGAAVMAGLVALRRRRKN